MNILILSGGRSVEHEVSLVSAAAVAAAVDTSRHTVTTVRIGHDGSWTLDNGKGEGLRVAVVPGGGFSAGGGVLPADVVFPVLHGTGGEDGIVQGLLEAARVPYVGCGVLSSALGMDKEIAKIIWKNSGLPLVPWVAVRACDDTPAKIREAESVLGPYPLFVKPVNGGSSVGSGRAADRSALASLVGAAFTLDHKVLIERAINAREVETSVTGDSVLGSGSVRVWGTGEIRSKSGFYDYESKYTDPEGAALLIPARLDAEVAAFIEKTAAAAYTALNCSGLARVDFFVDSRSGEVFLNEINTMPGFTPISMFPKIAAAGGFGFTALVEDLLDAALLRFSAKNALHFSKSMIQ